MEAAARAGNAMAQHLKLGMSDMWMPAQTTVPPGASARKAAGTSAPTGA